MPPPYGPCLNAGLLRVMPGHAGMAGQSAGMTTPEAKSPGVGASRLSTAFHGLGQLLREATVTWLHPFDGDFAISARAHCRLTPYEAHVAYGAAL